MLGVKRVGLLLEVISIFTTISVSGQDVIRSGGVQAVLPSHEWVSSMPPASQKQRADLKPLICAEAHHGAIKLHVTQFEYPAGVTEQQLAHFLEHLRDSYQPQAFGQIGETSHQVGGYPATDLDVKCRGWNLLRARAVFCEKRAYLVEVGGSAEYQKEADQCWDGVTFTGEAPLNGSTFSKVVDIRDKAQAVMTRYSQPPSRAGIYAIEFLAFAGGVAGGLWLSIRAARRLRSGKPIFRRGRRRRRHRSSIPMPVGVRLHQ